MQCARHPDVTADGTCARCGDFVCRGCRHPTYPDHCSGCGGRLPRGIAWEDARYGPLPWRYLLTFRDVLWNPKVAFPGPTGVAAPLSFALVGGCVLLLAIAGVGATMEAAGAIALPEAPPIGGTLICGVAFWGALAASALAMAAMLLGLSFGIGLLTVGRRRGLGRFGFRAASYGTAVFTALFLAGCVVATATVSIDGLDPELSHLVWLALAAAWPPLTGRVFVYAARGLGLTTGRAMVAAAGPTILCTIPAAYLSYVQLGLFP